MIKESCGAPNAEPVNLNVVFKQLRMDDNTLLQKFSRICSDICDKKSMLDKENKKKGDDYLNLILARLSYGFSKEEYNALSTEIERRGLTV